MQAPVGHDGRSMQDQPPDTKPGIIPSVGTLARTHGSRALRIAAWCAGGVAALAIVGGAIHLAKKPPAPPPVSPAGSKGLTVSWTASLGDGPVTGVATSADTLYVSGIDGLSRYPLPCVARGGTCHATWQDPIPDGPLSRAALLNDGIYVGAAHGHVYAFPTQCSVPHCRPVWNGEAGDGPVPTPSVNDDFVYAATRRLYAFPTHCGTDDRNCPAAWIGDLPGRAAGSPQGGGGLVVVSSMGKAGRHRGVPRGLHRSLSCRCGPAPRVVPRGPRRCRRTPRSSWRTANCWRSPCRAPAPARPPGPAPCRAVPPPRARSARPSGRRLRLRRGRRWHALRVRHLVRPDLVRAGRHLPVGPVASVDADRRTGGGLRRFAQRHDQRVPRGVRSTATPPPSAACGTPTARTSRTGSEAAPDAADGALYVGDDDGTVHAFTLLAPPS